MSNWGSESAAKAHIPQESRGCVLLIVGLVPFLLAAVALYFAKRLRAARHHPSRLRPWMKRSAPSAGVSAES